MHLLPQRGKEGTGSVTRLLHSAPPAVAPRAQFREELLHRLNQAQATQAAHSHAWRSRRNLYRISGSLVAMLLLGGGVWWALASQQVARADFGQMLRRVSQIKSVSYTVITKGPTVAFSARFTFQPPGRVRIDHSDGAIIIVDGGNAMKLTPARKRARLYYSGNDPRLSNTGPLEALLQAIRSDARFVTRERLGAQLADVYDVTADGSPLRVWVNPYRQLPLRIETAMAGSNGEQATAVMEDFRWNEELPDSLFSLEPPAGYSVIRADPGSESSLMALLSFMMQDAERFPAKLDLAELLSAFKRRYSKDMTMFRSDSDVVPGTSEIAPAAQGTYVKCEPAFRFIGQINESGEFRYTGAGVKVGDASAVVCWWRLAGSETVKVVYGNLTIKEVPASDFKPPVPATIP